MTMHDEPFDRALPSLFVELASASTPDYLEAAIERASSRPQRPAWTYPGRWLPVDITTQAAPVARMPWRQLGMLALIGLLLAVAAVAYIGSQRTRPAPHFGLAENGAVAMERDGDIVTVDHATGTVTPIITGPELDRAPVYSRDGTRIGFERSVDVSGNSVLIMIANADGTGLIQATPEPLSGLQSWTLSPDGRDLLLTTKDGGVSKLAELDVDGSGTPSRVEISPPATLDPDAPAIFRPPDGREILVVAWPAGSATRGIYAVDPGSGTPLRTIVEPAGDSDVCGANWSPTGDTLVYCAFNPLGDGPRFRAHVVSADGTGSQLLNPGPGVAYDGSQSDWSNDGTRLVVVRGEAADGTGERVLIMSVAGDAPPVEMACEPTGENKCADEWIWSPDDTMLLGVTSLDDGSTQYQLADPDTGQVTQTNWTGTGEPDWQRSAP
jgi:Tol biopolymer transport system component